MYEEEAEKWVKTNFHSTEEDYIKAFKDGAELGYNKANEWRKDIPSNDNAILCQIAKDEFEVGYYHTEKKRFYTIGGEEIEVIQWQEIIPPKFEETEG